MKYLLPALLLLFYSNITATAEPGKIKGIIVYRPFAGAGDSVANVKEYRRLQHFPKVINYIPAEKLSEVRVPASNLIQYVEYPELNTLTITGSAQYHEFTDLLQSLLEIENRFPQRKSPVRDEIEAMMQIKNRLQQEKEVLFEGRWITIPKTDLYLNGKYHLESWIKSVRGDSVLIGYAPGKIKWIKISALTPEQITQLNGTSLGAKIGITAEGINFSSPVLQSAEVLSILTPLVRSAGSQLYEKWDGKVRKDVGESARDTCNQLLSLSRRLLPEESKQVSWLAEDILSPFEQVRNILGGETQAKDALAAAIEDLNRVRALENRNSILLANENRKVEDARKRIKEFQTTKRKQAAESLRETNRKISQSLSAKNFPIAVAYSVCLYSLKDNKNLSFPFSPAVTRIWTTLSAMDEAKRNQARADAARDLIKWKKEFHKAGIKTAKASQELTAELFREDSRPWYLLIKVGETFKALDEQQKARIRVQQCFEVKIYKPYPTGESAFRLVEESLRGSRPGEKIALGVFGGICEGLATKEDQAEMARVLFYLVNENPKFLIN